MKRIAVILALFALLVAGCGISAPINANTAKPEQPKPVEESSPANVQEQSNLRSPENAVLVYDDEYVTVSFLGCEKKSGKDYMVFYAVNKTKATLTFDANSMAIDGESLGYIYGIETVAPESKGKIRFKADEQFPTMEPETISGGIEVYDFSFEVTSSTIHVQFSNVNVK